MCICVCVFVLCVFIHIIWINAYSVVFNCTYSLLLIFKWSRWPDAIIVVTPFCSDEIMSLYALCCADNRMYPPMTPTHNDWDQLQLNVPLLEWTNRFMSLKASLLPNKCSRIYSGSTLHVSDMAVMIHNAGLSDSAATNTFSSSDESSSF